MPVLTLMVWDLLDWEAWPSFFAAVNLSSVSGGKSPPSRLRASWILVSLVSRAMAAHRGLDALEDMVVRCWVSKNRLAVNRSQASSSSA